MSRRALSRLAALVLGLALVEGAVAFVVRDGTLLGRPLPPFGAVNGPRQRAWVERLRSSDPFRLAAFDAELGWEWKPGATSDDGGVHLNSRGARGTREYADRPPDGVVRLVFTGDSYAFCDEMADEYAFEHYLERRRPEVEAWNLGVNGYGTDQALLRWRRRGRGVGAAVVFVGVLAENVGRNANRLRPLWNPNSGFCFPKPRFVLEGEELVLLPQPYADRAALVAAFDDGTLAGSLAEHERWRDVPALGPFARSAVARVAALPLAHRARDPLTLWADPAGEPRRVTLAILATFRREALADGARHAPVLLFPSRQDVLEAQREGLDRWNAVVEALRGAGLEHLDLLPPLLARKAELDADPTQGELFFRGHLSSVGNDVVARTVERWLVERTILQGPAGDPPAPPPDDER